MERSPLHAGIFLLRVPGSSLASGLYVWVSISARLNLRDPKSSQFAENAVTRTNVVFSTASLGFEKWSISNS